MVEGLFIIVQKIRYLNSILVERGRLFPSVIGVSETKIAEFANSVYLDGVAYNEPPHLELHCLPSSF